VRRFLERKIFDCILGGRVIFMLFLLLLIAQPLERAAPGYVRTAKWS